MSRGISAVTPAFSKVSQSRPTRSVKRLSGSPKAREAGPPTWRIRPGPARKLKILATPTSTSSDPITAAIWEDASTPFCSGRTTVPGPIILRIARAASGTCHAFTAKRTRSTGPVSAGSSVACAGRTTKSPRTLSTRRPCSRIAERCSPRAMKVTSCPAIARRPP